MEAFSMYLLSLAVVLVSFLIAFLNQRGNSNRHKLPPGTFGFPIVGETFHLFSNGPEKFFRRRMEKYSDQVFTTSLFGEKVAVVCGAAGNKFLLYTANDRLAPWVPSAVAKLLSWSDSPGLPIKNLISRGRQFLYSEILKPESLRQYISIMDSMAKEHTKTYWVPSQVVKVYPLTQKYTLSLACRLLLGAEDAYQIQRISDSLHLTMQGLFSLPVNLPGTAYNRALKELQKLKQQLLNIIAEKKKKVALENRERANSDVLSRILLDGNTHSMSDAEIGLSLMGLILPTYESTSASITFVLKYLAELPHIYDMVYKEHMEIAQSKAPEELLNLEDIKKMKYSWNVIYEALRLTPPTLLIFREARTDVNFAGFTIPKAWKVIWTSFTTNKNPKYFHDPETFDPTRFEGDGPIPCSFVPFSAGPRMCPGKEFSMFLMLVYIYNVVKNFKLQKMIQDEKIHYRAGAVPANGLPIRVQLHK